MRHVPLAAMLLAFTAAGAADAATQIELDEFEDVTALGFEELTPGAIVTTDYFGLGVTFQLGDPSFLSFRSSPYSQFSAALETVASALGLGLRGILLPGDGQLMSFWLPPRRVGFYLGADLPIEVPVEVQGDDLEPPTEFVLSVPVDEMRFFGFDDPDGIASIRLGVELTGDFGSQLDGLRFEHEPTGSVRRIAQDDFSGAEPVLSFDEFQTGVYLLDDDFADQGVVFDSSVGAWQLDDYASYGDELVAAAAAIGAGDRGPIHLGEAETIAFDPTSSRVGFHFGSNANVRVPLSFHRDGAELGTFPIVVPADQIGFFGFADAGGIDEIRFGTEQVSGYSSNLDLLRFAPEPGGASLAAVIALLALAPRALARRRGR